MTSEVQETVGRVIFPLSRLPCFHFHVTLRNLRVTLSFDIFDLIHRNKYLKTFSAMAIQLMKTIDVFRLDFQLPVY